MTTPLQDAINAPYHGLTVGQKATLNEAARENEKLRAALVAARDALDACGLAFQWLMQDDLFAKVSTKSQCIKAQHMAAKCAEDLTATIDAALNGGRDAG